MLFQLGWLLIIINSQTWHFYWILPCFGIFLVCQNHFQALSKSFFKGVLAFSLLGICSDLLFLYAKLITFEMPQTQHNFLYQFAGYPNWLFLMWFWFSLSFLLCYQWLEGRAKLGAVLGAVFGPLAYWGATHLTVLTIQQPLWFTLLSGLFWGGYFYAYLSNFQRILAKPINSKTD
ncbi:DUF2878 family protein [Aliikangiella sp. IMCC44632]